MARKGIWWAGQTHILSACQQPQFGFKQSMGETTWVLCCSWNHWKVTVSAVGRLSKDHSQGSFQITWIWGFAYGEPRGQRRLISPACHILTLPLKLGQLWIRFHIASGEVGVFWVMVQRREWWSLPSRRSEMTRASFINAVPLSPPQNQRNPW